ncbi:hypothetical protein PCC8801_3438 [Rippkaea orientalis PCC 8801]|uniref:DUF2335 domain-containing protein n=1 Tax=Rippkaea orientalis (strain PCC 8801 / RF-1) TaxID=41431 RepID=B7K0C2_RIPO1|nr:DUF2335 domain-containing protein [Rippkaea orientalis]ACK67406.1 hypothetical protein PCC8801_3438 [Rippkaea orientalis PCC 8801]
MPKQDYSENEESNQETEAIVASDPLESSSDNSKLASRRVFAISSFAGPLPPPEQLKAYDLIKPGLAGEYFNLVKKQAEHRMELEKLVILGDGKRSWVGLVLGFLIVCFFLGCSTFLIIQGHDTAGSVLGTTSLVSLAGVFVYGTQSRVQERKEKRKALFGSDSDE